jgi:hypothetical protein
MKITQAQQRSNFWRIELLEIAKGRREESFATAVFASHGLAARSEFCPTAVSVGATAVLMFLQVPKTSINRL